MSQKIIQFHNYRITGHSLTLVEQQIRRKIHQHIQTLGEPITHYFDNTRVHQQKD
jgi:hypothetical protein